MGAEVVKDQIKDVLRFMEEKSGTVDYPRTMRMEETFEVYCKLKNIVAEL